LNVFVHHISISSIKSRLDHLYTSKCDFYQREIFCVLNVITFWRHVFISLCFCSMRVQEIWKCIHPRVSYSPRVLPSGNMILLGEYIFIFPSPACNKCIILHQFCQECVRAYLSIHDCLSFLHEVMIGNHRTKTFLHEVMIGNHRNKTTES
jgi:hypothetical protein